MQIHINFVLKKKMDILSISYDISVHQ